MLAQTGGGGLIKIRLDMVSTRPSVTTTYQLQGTEGCFESARRADEQDRIWLSSIHEGPETWGFLKDLESQYLPTRWREMFNAVGEAGHGGTDSLMSLAFLDAVLNDEPPPIDIDRAMDMSLPCLISQTSMEQQGSWLDVPDSRNWSAGSA
jgi:hypothetical protein